MNRDDSLPTFLTPTPAPVSATVGQWTISVSLGRGVFGNVQAATNNKKRDGRP